MRGPRSAAFSQTYEFLRVAHVLRRLLKIDHMYRVGALGWSDVREIVRVALPETEDKWIEFARERSILQVEAEVKDALEKQFAADVPAEVAVHPAWRWLLCGESAPCEGL